MSPYPWHNKIKKGTLTIAVWAGLLSWAITFYPDVLVTLTSALEPKLKPKPLRNFDPNVRVLDDTSGAISQIVMNIPGEYHDQVLPAVQSFVPQLPPGIQIIFACSNETGVRSLAEHLDSIESQSLDTADIVLTNLRLTPWARDRRIARSGPKGAEHFSLIPPTKDWYDTDRRSELKLPNLLNDLNLAPESISLPFILDGGNLVTDSHFAFIGGNNIESNENVIPNLRDLKRMLQLYLGVPPVHIFARNQQVPWHHLDMYVTPLPGRRVLVASPSLAEKLLREAQEQNPIAREKFLRLSFSPERTRLFDDVAKQFQKLKYTVIRTPAIPHYLDQWMITYNNVLMDFRGEQSNVFLPSYGITSLDNFARALYQDLGFNVHAIDLSSLYREGGSIRCFANITRRTPASKENKSSPGLSNGDITIHRPGMWINEHLRSRANTRPTTIQEPLN